MARLGRTLVVTGAFFLGALLGGVLQAYIDSHMLGHVTKLGETPAGQFRLGVGVNSVTAAVASALLFFTYILSSRRWPGLPPSLLGGLAGLLYPLPLSAISVLTWQQQGSHVIVVFILMFAYLVAAPVLLGRRLAAMPGGLSESST